MRIRGSGNREDVSKKISHSKLGKERKKEERKKEKSGEQYCPTMTKGNIGQFGVIEAKTLFWSIYSMFFIIV